MSRRAYVLASLACFGAFGLLLYVYLSAFPKRPDSRWFEAIPVVLLGLTWAYFQNRIRDRRRLSK